MPTGADISLSLYPEVLINPRVFLVRIFNIDTEQELLLRKIVIRTGATGNANGRNSMDTDAKRNTMEERISETRGPGPAKFIASSLQTRTNHESSRLTDDKMPVLLRGRPAGRRLINDDKRDENGFDLSGE